jgi:hypothetical protein
LGKKDNQTITEAEAIAIATKRAEGMTEAEMKNLLYPEAPNQDGMAMTSHDDSSSGYPMFVTESAEPPKPKRSPTWRSFLQPGDKKLSALEKDMAEDSQARNTRVARQSYENP